MSRRIAALKPQLNRIRAWAHEGSTDAWIAHQLETTAESVRAFRQEHGIERGGPAPLAPITPDSVVEAMLAEEAAALEAGPEPESPAESVDEAETAPAPVRAPRRRARKVPVADAADGDEAAPVAEPSETAADGDDADAPAKPARRRGARGGAGRTSAAVATDEDEVPAESRDDEPADEHESNDDGDADEAAAATSGDEPVRSSRKRGRRRGRGRGSRGLEARLLSGSVLLLDPSVTADATFQEHWQGGGPLRVEVSAETIVLRRIVHADADGERSDRSRDA
jgi:hypothetical protein